MEPPRKPAWDKALDFLNRKALSRRQLAEKLRAAGYPSPEIRAAVERAERLNLVNDALLAQDYARTIAAGGVGRYRIRQKLRTKLFDAATVTEAVATTEEGEKEQAEKAFDYKLRMLSRESDWRKKREKMFRYLVGRGFPVAVVKELAQRIGPNE